MCGVMGWYRVRKMTNDGALLVDELMRAIEARGRDAAGVSVQVVGTAAEAVKHHVRATDFVKLNEYKKLRERFKDANCIIGHSRAATHGDKRENDNNHPHWTENMKHVLVHNGIVSGASSWLWDMCNSECDSETILRAVEALGVEAAFRETMSWDYSDMTVLLQERGTETMYFWRNDGRPLVGVNASKTAGGWLFVSTEHLLRKAWIRVVRKGIPVSAIWEAEPFVLYKMSPGDRKPQAVMEIPEEERPGDPPVHQSSASCHRVCRDSNYPVYNRQTYTSICDKWRGIEPWWERQAREDMESLLADDFDENGNYAPGRNK